MQIQDLTPVALDYDKCVNILETLTRITVSFRQEGVDFALIGGLALHAQGVTRATTDVNALILVQDKQKVRNIMTRSGFSVFHESADVMSFVDMTTQGVRVDFLLAHRPYALATLKRAESKQFLDGSSIKVLRPEDLIGLKVQAVANDPTRRDQDMADIRSLIRVHNVSLDWPLIREYFSLFQAEPELDRLLKEEGLASHS